MFLACARKDVIQPASNHIVFELLVPEIVEMFTKLYGKPPCIFRR